MYIEDKILNLKKKRNAVILAHYYQDEDIQDIADFVGDSLDLSRKAANTSCDTIVFCGVKFMAEVAKILNPMKNVVIPDLKAGCSLEQSCPSHSFKKFKEQNPNHLIISYINCSAEIKALSDIIVTSSNAKKIIDQLPKNENIIFAPDQHLGCYLNKITGRNMLLWRGSCIVHETFSEKEIVKLKIRNPKSELIAHPECPEEILRHAEHIGSTSSLLKHTENSGSSSFIVATEPHIIHQMKKRAPQKEFIIAPGNDGSCSCSKCPFMELNTMEKLHHCLENNTPSIYMNSVLMKSAKKPLIKMLEMS
tara:strand:- start:493 stop:1413 length:921 start_codon:yes stop_codon:yes gene_type:complete